MNINELNKAKLPIIVIDKALHKYKTKVLFREKLDKANDVLKKIGLPKINACQFRKVLWPYPSLACPLTGHQIKYSNSDLSGDRPGLWTCQGTGRGYG